MFGNHPPHTNRTLRYKLSFNKVNNDIDLDLENVLYVLYVVMYSFICSSLLANQVVDDNTIRIVLYQ